MGLRRCRCLGVILIITLVTTIYLISHSGYSHNKRSPPIKQHHKSGSTHHHASQIQSHGKQSDDITHQVVEKDSKLWKNVVTFDGRADEDDKIMKNVLDELDDVSKELKAQGTKRAEVEPKNGILEQTSLGIRPAKDYSLLKQRNVVQSRLVQKENLKASLRAAMASTPTINPYDNSDFQSVQVTKSPILHPIPTQTFGDDIIVEKSQPQPHENVNFPPLPKISGQVSPPLQKISGQTSAVSMDHSHLLPMSVKRLLHISPTIVIASDRRMKDFKNLSKAENMLSDLHVSMQKHRIYQQAKLSHAKRRAKNLPPRNFDKRNIGNPSAVVEFMESEIDDIPSQQFPHYAMPYIDDPIAPKQKDKVLQGQTNIVTYPAHRAHSPQPGAKHDVLTARGENSIQDDALLRGQRIYKPYHKTLGLYDNVDTRPQINFVKEGYPIETRKQDLTVKPKNTMDANDNLNTGTMTTVPSTTNDSTLNNPIKYEELPNGDLSVHNKPANISTTQSNDSAETKIEDIKGETNSTLKETAPPALRRSKAFLKSLTNDDVKKETVATVHKHHFIKPTTIKSINELWQIQVDGVEIFLYSAYFDDRPAAERHTVRIIGIADVNMEDPHCLLWYDNKQEPDIAIAEVTKIGPRIHPLDTRDNKYEAYLFTCNLKENNRPPKEVSIITAKHTTATNLLEVQIPVKPPPEEQIEIGQCMSIIYWYQDPIKVVEWLELHRIWGVGEITVYTDELSPDSLAVFQHYANEGLVDLRSMPSVLDDDGECVILLNMSPAINDCMYRNMYRYKRVMCTDVDEMIVPRTANNYTEMLDQILKNSKTKHPHPSFMFRNVYFFSDFGPLTEEPWFLMTQRYLKHITPSTFGYSVKSITDPQACIALQNHLCWKRFKKYDSKKLRWSVDVPLRLARNQHYKKCHFDLYLGQWGACKRLMSTHFVDRNIERFGDQLYNNTAVKLMELKIAEEDLEAEGTT